MGTLAIQNFYNGKHSNVVATTTWVVTMTHYQYFRIIPTHYGWYIHRTK